LKRVLVINPIGHTRWDEADAKIYRSYASPDTSVEVRSLPAGPETVETYKAYLESEKYVVELGEKLHQNYDAIIVNCFLDPGVSTLRKRIGDKVVAGPCESSLSIARFYGDIGVITVGAEEEGLTMIRERVKSLGFERNVAGVWGIPIGVADIEKDWNKTLDLLEREAVKAKIAGADVLVLGCTGLAGLARSLERRVHVRVIDPTWAAIKMAETLLSVGKGE
jgi:allantoin racemase